MKKKYPKIFLYLVFLLAIVIFLYAVHQVSRVIKIPSPLVIIPISTPTPTPFIFRAYTAPIIEKKQVYKIVMIGDSMTAALGPHGGGLSEYMNTLYKNDQNSQRILIDNYAKPSNILSVNEELSWKTTISEYTFGPLLSEDFDLILIESYAYNPLSQFGVDEGIKQQNLALDKLMSILIPAHPKAAIVFVATIAPNIDNYAKTTQINSSSAGRAKQAQERISYLKNHITYAQSHNIPLINIYEKSLTEKGDGNMIYINPVDDIHPSFAGIAFVGQEIGNFIHDNQILPE